MNLRDHVIAQIVRCERHEAAQTAHRKAKELGWTTSKLMEEEVILQDLAERIIRSACDRSDDAMLSQILAKRVTWLLQTT